MHNKLRTALGKTDSGKEIMGKVLNLALKLSAYNSERTSDARLPHTPAGSLRESGSDVCVCQG